MLLGRGDMTITRCIVTNKSKVSKSVVTGGRSYEFYPGINKPMFLNPGALIFCGRDGDLEVEQIGAEVFDKDGQKVKSTSKKARVTPEKVKAAAVEDTEPPQEDASVSGDGVSALDAWR